MKSLKISFLLILLFILKNSNAATYYWVDGHGNWDNADASHWSLTSGGAGNAGVPSQNDDVIFDSLSFYEPYYVTISGSVHCKNFIYVPKSETIGEEFLGGGNMYPHFEGNSADSLFIHAGMTIPDYINWYGFYGNAVFVANTTGNVIETDGSTFGGNIIFNGSGSWNWNMINMNMVDIYNDIEFHKGTLNTNDIQIQCGNFYAVGGSTKNLNLSNTLVKVRYSWDLSSSAAGSVNISGNPSIQIDNSYTETYFYGNDLTYGDITVSGNGNTCYMYGNNTFKSFTLYSNYNSNMASLYGDNHIDDVTVYPPSYSSNSIRIGDGKTLYFNNIHLNGSSSYDNSIYTEETGSSIVDMDGGKNCFEHITVYGINASGGQYYVYQGYVDGTSTGWDTTGLSEKPMPYASIYTNDDHNNFLCLGDTITLSSNDTNTTNTYVWYSASGVLGNSSSIISLPSQTGYYSLSVTDNFTGCAVKDSVFLHITSFTASAGNDTAVCQGSSIQLSATSSGSSSSYYWSPAGSISGSPNYQTITTIPLSSDVIFTVSAYEYVNCGDCYPLYCVQEDYVNVIVDTHTVSAAAAAPNPVCLGDTINLAATGNGYVFNWTSSSGGGLISSYGKTVKALPSTNSSFTVTGCNNFMSTNVVIASPNVDAGANTSLCKGSAITLNATGAVSYEWMPATDLSSTAIANPVANPFATRKYFVKGTDGNGCSKIDSIILSVTPAKIAGNVTYSGGAVAGTPNTYVKLYRYDYNAEMQKMDSVGLDGSGNYLFQGLSQKDTAIIYVKADTSIYHNTIGTYYSNTFEWINATKINPGCPSTSANITLSQSLPATGTSTVKGRITEGEGFGKKEAAGDGIKDVEVGLKKKPGGQSMMTKTNANGDYTILNVPQGEYTMVVEIPGLPVISNYTISITAGNSIVDDIDFEADSNKIEANSSTYIRELSPTISALAIYPNPADKFTNVSVDLVEQSDVKISLHDVIGREIGCIVNQSYTKGKHSINVNLSSYNEGIYLIKTQINTDTYIDKLLKSK